jgi:phosphodiesterase/alkaline phosphatase D-like protein
MQGPEESDMNLRLLFAAILIFLQAAVVRAEAPCNAMGEKAGEVDQHSAILMTRLTAAAERDSVGNVPGAPGWVSFELSRYDDFSQSRFTPWRQAVPGHDYIVKEAVAGLAAGSRYFYRVLIGSEAGRAERTGPNRTFLTAPEADQVRDVAFVTTCCNVYNTLDNPLGYESHASMLRLRPDFIVTTGDNVYYDRDEPYGYDIPTCRFHWQRMFSLPRFVELWGNTTGYWQKDDHDYRCDDADPYMDGRNPYVKDRVLIGIDDSTGRALFKEQAPVGDANYRTFRWGQALQIWIPEGRDYRSPNEMPDGPGKTLWGVEQRRWLEKSILASDATFKVLVSPTAIIGPDRASKKDGHANRAGFFTEGQNFLRRLKEREVKNFYLAVGDRHWKYHSVHKETGYEEFGNGCVSDGASVTDPAYSDPTAERRFALGNGGFMLIRVLAEGREKPALVFDLYEKDGNLVYSQTREYQGN